MKAKYSSGVDLYRNCHTKDIPLIHTAGTMAVIFDKNKIMDKWIDGVQFVAVAAQSPSGAFLRWMRKDAFNWRKRVG